MAATDNAGLRAATLQVLANQLRDARDTAAILEIDYHAGVTHELLHLMGDHLNAYRRTVDLMRDHEQAEHDSRTDLRTDWCPACMGMRSVRCEQGGWFCVVCGYPVEQLRLVEGGAS